MVAHSARLRVNSADEPTALPCSCLSPRRWKKGGGGENNELSDIVVDEFIQEPDVAAAATEEREHSSTGLVEQEEDKDEEREAQAQEPAENGGRVDSSNEAPVVSGETTMAAIDVEDKEKAQDDVDEDINVDKGAAVEEIAEKEPVRSTSEAAEKDAPTNDADKEADDGGKEADDGDKLKMGGAGKSLLKLAKTRPKPQTPKRALFDDIPDDESEASIEVSFRFMGCTQEAYGERAVSDNEEDDDDDDETMELTDKQTTDDNVGDVLHSPSGKLLVDSDEDDDGKQNSSDEGIVNEEQNEGPSIDEQVEDAPSDEKIEDVPSDEKVGDTTPSPDEEVDDTTPSPDEEVDDSTASPIEQVDDTTPSLDEQVDGVNSADEPTALPCSCLSPRRWKKGGGGGGGGGGENNELNNGVSDIVVDEFIQEPDVAAAATEEREHSSTGLVEQEEDKDEEREAQAQEPAESGGEAGRVDSSNEAPVVSGETSSMAVNHVEDEEKAQNDVDGDINVDKGAVVEEVAEEEQIIVTPKRALFDDIPDDESEASIEVLFRYMGCTEQAYGERPTISATMTMETAYTYETSEDDNDLIENIETLESATDNEEREFRYKLHSFEDVGEEGVDEALQKACEKQNVIEPQTRTLTLMRSMQNPGKATMEVGGEETQNLFDQFISVPSGSKSKPMAEKRRTCDYCSKTGVIKLSMCSRCKKVSYCNRECQVAAWKTHKTTCVAIDKDKERKSLPQTLEQVGAGGSPEQGGTLEVRAILDGSQTRQVSMHGQSRSGKAIAA